MRVLACLLAAALVAAVLVSLAGAADSSLSRRSHLHHRRHHASLPKEPIAPPTPAGGAADNAPVEDDQDNGTDQDNDENPPPPLSKPTMPTPLMAPAASQTAAAGNGDIPAAGLSASASGNSGVQDPSEANANAVRNQNGLFCSNVGPRHLTLQCKEHPDGNCCGTAGFCCPKDHYCSLDANGQPTSKCVKQRRQIVISPTIVIHTGPNGVNLNGISPAASTTASTGLPDGVDTSDDVDDSDSNEDSGLEDQDYNANQPDSVTRRPNALHHARRDKIVLVMHNRNKITRGKKHGAEKEDDDDDEDGDDDEKQTQKSKGDTDSDAAPTDPTGAKKDAGADATKAPAAADKTNEAA